MKPLKFIVSDALKKAFAQLFPDQSSLHHLVEQSVSMSSSPKFGHFQSNLAMQLSKQLKIPPRQIASEISSTLACSDFASVHVAGPGFINITLATHLISSYCNQQLHHSRLGCESMNLSKIIIDFSSPNIAKEMHVGHLRSTIIGDCLANVFEFLGYEVLRLNHVGDWGTAFGMLIVYLKQHHPEIVSGKQSSNLSDLVGWYKQSKVCFDEDPLFKKDAQMQVVKLQQGDIESRQAWQLICDISREGFQKIYDALGIKLIERGESFYNPWLNEVIESINARGLLSISDGAKCVYLDGFQNREGEPLPLIVQKSDGGFNYATTDLAAIRHRVSAEQAKRIIYVTDSGQGLHFSMVFATASKAQFYDPDEVALEHAGFGLVLGEDGKKFKTRSGDVVRLQSLLDKAVEKAKAIFTERNSDWNMQVINRAASILGIAAIKYADLSNNRMSDYQFSFERMLKFEGNTAAFILYSFVRINSILDKSKISSDELAAHEIVMEHESEIDLAFHLTRFSAVVLKLSNDLNPHYLTDYLYLLAQKYNMFFRDCRVHGDANEASRLLLCRLTSRIIEKGLNLLGIDVLERM
jgi:arginyl-tRNA synthetase